MPDDHRIAIFNTIRAFEDGITSLSLDAAVTTITGWIDRIDATGKPELQGVASLLGTLRGQLQADALDGTAIGTTMQRLGPHTAEAARLTDDATLAEAIQQLGGLVKAAGVALAGGSRPDEVAGVSTDRDSLSVSDDEATNTTMEVNSDIGALPEDETPGTTFRPH